MSATERDRIRAAVQAIDVNYVGPEGRGAAKSVRDKALRVIAAEWTRTDAEDHRRTAILADLRAEVLHAMVSVPGLSADKAEPIADHVAGYLAVFVLTLDGRTWTEPDPDA